MTPPLPHTPPHDLPRDRHQDTAAAHGGGVLVRLVRAAARLAQRRPRTLIALWLLLVVACTAAGSLAGTRSMTDLQGEVGQSAQADNLVHRAGIDDPVVENVLVSASSATAAAHAASALEARLHAVPEVASVRGPADTAGLTADGGRIVLVQAVLAGDPQKAGDHVAPVQQAVAAVQGSRDAAGARLQEAGPGSEDREINAMISHDLGTAEKISLPITLVILVLAFGALVAASVPLLLGLTSVAAALGALGLVSRIAPSGDSTSAVVALFGLAVGVDYSLFYLRRAREERRRGLPDGRDHRPRRERRAARRRGEARPAPLTSGTALDAAAASVGRAVLIAGLTVVVAVAGLLITRQAEFVSMALGTILVVLIAVLGSLTVLPAVLALLGDRADRGRLPGHRRMQARKARREAAAGRRTGFWAALARVVTARPKAFLLIAVCVLGALAVPLTGMRTANVGIDDMPSSLGVAQAVRAIDHSFPGAPDSAELVVRGQQLDTHAAKSALTALGERAAVATGGASGTGHSGKVSATGIRVTVTGDGTLARVDVPMPDRGQKAAEATVHTLRDHVAATASAVPGAHGPALVTGDAAQNVDYTARMSKATPEVIAFVLVLGFLLLLFTFRAPLLAAAVMLLNLVSIGAAYGLLVAVFQHHWADRLLGFQATGHIVNWLPLFMFVILFGLSMDYTVLVLERIREARRAGLDARRAAAEGVAATAGTVTSAAVVMVAVFGIFATLDMITFKQLGVGLAAAVLLDATLVRGVALPAVVALLGERGWPVKPVPGHPAAAPTNGPTDLQLPNAPLPQGRTWNDDDMSAAQNRGRA